MCKVINADRRNGKMVNKATCSFEELVVCLDKSQMIDIKEDVMYSMWHNIYFLMWRRGKA